MDINNLIKKLENLSGKKVVLKEAKPKKEKSVLDKTNDALTAKNKQDVEDYKKSLRPSGKERSDAHSNLYNLVKRFERDQEKYEKAVEPFNKIIEATNESLNKIKGEWDPKISEYKEQIAEMMHELNITTKKVGDAIVNLDYSRDRRTPSYKSMVATIESFDGFLEAYEAAYVELIEKMTTFSEIKKSIYLQKESFIIKENMFKNLFRTVLNSFKSLYRAFAKANKEGNELVAHLRSLTQG